MNLYSIRDHKAGASHAPYTAQNDGIAMRYAANLMTDNPTSDLARYPNDYALYRLGSFDSVANLVKGLPDGGEHVSDMSVIKEIVK